MLAIGAQLSVGEDQLGSGVHGHGSRDLGFQLAPALLAPPAPQGSIAKLSRRLEGDEGWAPDDDWLVESDQRGPSEFCPKTSVSMTMGPRRPPTVTS
jgi:hypothetical protein